MTGTARELHTAQGTRLAGLRSLHNSIGEPQLDIYRTPELKTFPCQHHLGQLALPEERPA